MPSGGAQAELLEALRVGAIEVEGRMPWSSNLTLLTHVATEDGLEMRAIYKPGQGEQQLADFPPNIYKREIAAFEFASALGWPNIPETVERADAPFGPGSLQRFIPSDFEQHYFTLMEQQLPAYLESFFALAVFDLVANNADRKAGHCLLAETGEIWAIDNGLSFHVEPKLRTVIWEFGGLQVDEGLLSDLDRVATKPPPEFLALLTEVEIIAWKERIRALIKNPVLPEPVSHRQFPWPLI